MALSHLNIINIRGKKINEWNKENTHTKFFSTTQLFSLNVFYGRKS